MKKLLILPLFLILLGGVFFLLMQNDDSTVDVTDVSMSATKEKNEGYDEQVEPPETPETPEEVEYDIESASSLQVVVNKQRPISLDYVPQKLRSPDVATTDAGWQLRDEAATALEQMFEAASSDGISLVLGSAYRSSAYQKELYDGYVAQFGQAEADKFSARPGTSEHQLGLAADISSLSGSCFLEICFEDTAEGMWLKENAWKYGYVIRYPSGKEAITGYQYEPWHIRYLGKNLAQELYDSNQTLEEFFQL